MHFSLASFIMYLICVYLVFFHLYAMILEMFFWEKAIGLKVFRQTPESARASAVLAKNQGLYNGILAVGLLIALLRSDGFSLMFFFCAITVAGAYGAVTTRNLRIFLMQGLPALGAGVLLYFVNAP
jgi:putative membrane protein